MSPEREKDGDFLKSKQSRKLYGIVKTIETDLGFSYPLGDDWIGEKLTQKLREHSHSNMLACEKKAFRMINVRDWHIGCAQPSQGC
jgi:hypothetical protein